MFILPGLVISSYITGMPFTREERLEMIRYLFNRAHPEDGGWGMYAVTFSFRKRGGEELMRFYSGGIDI